MSKTKKNFENWIKGEMKNRSLSQERFAKLIGHPHQSGVSRIITGEQMLNVPMAVRISEVLKVPVRTICMMYVGGR